MLYPVNDIMNVKTVKQLCKTDDDEHSGIQIS